MSLSIARSSWCACDGVQQWRAPTDPFHVNPAPQAKGPPSGGPGGAGGSVYLVASPSVTSLSHLPRTIRGGPGQPGGGSWLGGKRGEDMVVRVPVGTVVKEVRWEIPAEIEREAAEREELEWAWDASKIRLAEAERRDRRWTAWKKKKEVAEKEGEIWEAFEELEEVEVEEGKQQALERVRKQLFVMYPLADLASHPSFLYSEHQLLSKLLSRQAATSGKKTRRRKTRIVTEEEPLFLDLTKPTSLADPILLLSGGQPGLGNPSFQSADDRSPKYATKGGDGESMRLELEVKAGGEVGLVGMPNAGKRCACSGLAPALRVWLTESVLHSTLLRALTSSTPRVASYAFTTLNPHHGTCVLYSDDTFSGPRSPTASITDTSSLPETFSATSQLPSRAARRAHASSSSATAAAASPSSPSPTVQRTETLRFTITDNPGLVPQSSLNVGLGHAFLRHVERCTALVYVVDLSAADPVAALESLRTELREYARMKGLDGELEARIRGVVANKADLFGKERGEEEGELGEDPAMRASAEEGQRKLGELMQYVKRVEGEEMEAGVRGKEDLIWVVPLSAKRRENVSVLVKRLADTVLLERRRAQEKEQEAERVLEEERATALERLEGMRSARR